MRYSEYSANRDLAAETARLRAIYGGQGTRSRLRVARPIPAAFLALGLFLSCVFMAVVVAPVVVRVLS